MAQIISFQFAKFTFMMQRYAVMLFIVAFLVFDNHYLIAQVKQPPVLIYSAKKMVADSIAKYDIYDNAGKKLFADPVDWAYSNTWSWILVVDEKKKLTTAYNCYAEPIGIGSIEDTKSVYANVNRIGIKKNGKWGFYNRQGKLKIEHAYDSISTFYENIAAVKQGADRFIIDTNGVKLAIPYNKANYRFNFGDESIAIGIFDFIDNEYKIKEDNLKKGLVNNAGEIIVPIKYDGIFSLKKYFKLVTVKENNKFGVVQFGGKVIIPIQYATTFVLNDYF